MPNKDMHLGLGIKRIRMVSGITIAELSRKSGLSSSYLERIENGEQLPSTKSMNKIADQLGGVDFYLRLIPFS